MKGLTAFERHKAFIGDYGRLTVAVSADSLSLSFSSSQLFAEVVLSVHMDTKPGADVMHLAHIHMHNMRSMLSNLQRPTPQACAGTALPCVKHAVKEMSGNKQREQILVINHIDS